MAAQPGYGLILKKKKNTKTPSTAAAAFGGDSSDDESDAGPAVGAKQGGRAGVNYMMLQEAKKNKSNKKTQQGWMKAMEEDATVFQYDEVYDEIDQKKGEDVLRRQGKKAEDKRPKLIYQLMANAKKKKLQDELRDERQAQREREIEGEEFADKDVFVTGAYKKKLMELNAAAEEDRRKELEEERNDVTKKKDLSDLWRNMYNKKRVQEPDHVTDTTNSAADMTSSTADKTSSTADKTSSTADKTSSNADKTSSTATGTDADHVDAKSAARAPEASTHRRQPAPRDRLRRSNSADDAPPAHRDRENADRKRQSRDRSASPHKGSTRTYPPNRGASPPRRDRHGTATRDRRSPRGDDVTQTREAPAGGEAPGSKYARKTTEGAISDAKARYKARKAARGARKLATFDA